MIGLIAKIGKHIGSAAVPYEDLLTFTEVDSDSDITITKYVATFDTMDRDAISYVYKDYGINYFSNFDIDFEFEITTSQNNGTVQLCSLSNTIGTLQDMVDANDGIVTFAYTTGGNVLIYFIDRNTDNSDFYSGSGLSTPQLYCSLVRVGTTAYLYIYSDSARTILVDTLTITCETGIKRYLNVLASRDFVDVSATSSGYVQNININPNDYLDIYNNITSVDPSGDFTISQFKINVSSMQREAVAYNYIDYGAGYFGNFEIQFENEVTSIASLANLNFIGLTNTIGTRQDHLDANDGMCCQLYGGGGVGARYQLQEDILNNNDNYNPGGSSVPKRYFTFKRVSTTLYLYIYSDAARTILVDTLSCVCTHPIVTSFRYLHIAYSRELAGDAVTGYVQNVKIITAS
jgi:hypothetical protein